MSHLWRAWGHDDLNVKETPSLWQGETVIVVVGRGTRDDLKMKGNPNFMARVNRDRGCGLRAP